MTKQEALVCLDEITREIAQLKTAIERDWNEASSKNATQVFLEKCGRWEDDRSAEEIIADVYCSRTSSDTGANAFAEKSS